METLAERLTKTREKLGLSKAELKRKAGLRSASTLTELEAGTISQSPQLPAIAKALGVEPYWLQHGKEPGMINSVLKREERNDYDPRIAELISAFIMLDDAEQRKVLAKIKYKAELASIKDPPKKQA